MPVPKEEVLHYLWNVKNLEEYEPKVNSVEIFPQSENQGTYNSRGLFAGFLSWKARFSYHIDEHGFTSDMLTHPLGVSLTGGFRVQSKNSHQSTVSHYEDYFLPLWFLPLIPLLQLYLHLSLKKELRNVERAVTKAITKN